MAARFPEAAGSVRYPVERGEARPLAVAEPAPEGASRPRLLDRVRDALRARHSSRRTEKSYVAWIRRYIVFHGKRHPAEMGAVEVTQFLSSLAQQDHVAASTQNQALSALLFLYRQVLQFEMPWLDNVVRVKRSERLPVVLTREEVRAVIRELQGPPRLMAILLYGAGLRLLECARLRVKDVDFATNQIIVRAGKGDRDRVTMLPAVVKPDLVRHVEMVGRSTKPISGTAPAGWRSRGRWPGSTRTPAAIRRGSGCFRPRAFTSTGRRASAAGITCTNPCFCAL